MSSPRPSPLWSLGSARLGIAIALSLSLAIEGLMRSNINMAMVCMVNKTALALMAQSAEDGGGQEHWHSNLTVSSNGTFINNNGNKSSVFNYNLPEECVVDEQQHDGGVQQRQLYYSGTGDLVISKQEQSLIFTSFYLGGLVIILPGSLLCDLLGPTRLVLYGALLNVIGTVITPVTVRQLGPLALALVRFLMGCGQGILVPCVNVLIAHWFPLDEKSTAIAISTTGNQISVIAAMFITAELCLLTWLGGWASSFYIYSLVGTAFCALWLLLVTDYPAQSKRIGPEELRLLQHGTGTAGGHRRVNPKEVPWRRILRSMVVWSTGLSSFSQNFMNVGIVVYLPTYYQNVLGMDLTANGLMSALPFVVQLFTKVLFAAIADCMKRNEWMSPTAVTKLFNLIGSVGAGLCFILLSFCDCSTPYLAIALAVTAVGISSGFIPGYNTSVVCIAPRYTSSIASFSRLLGQIASVASPYMIGLIVVKGTKSEWQIAFWAMAAILISSGFLFQLFGSASIQEWALDNDPNTTFQMIRRGSIVDGGEKVEEGVGLVEKVGANSEKEEKQTGKKEEAE